MNKLIKMARTLTNKGDIFINKHGTKQFHVAAAELLQNSKLPELYEYQNLIEATFKDQFNKVNQNFGSLEFSDLPITLSRGDHCFIDIYFWRRRPTVIHNHHFAGAFQCLEGTNLDLEFSYVKQKSVGNYHSLGKIKIHQSHILKKGDIQSIPPLSKFIHQNHHHSELTVNLCFRTPEMKKGSISNYLYSGLSYEKNLILLQRVDRLLRFIQLDSFDFKKLDITLDDAIHFLVLTDGTSSQNKRLLDLRDYLNKKVKKEVQLNVADLLAKHDLKLEEIQDQYN